MHYKWVITPAKTLKKIPTTWSSSKCQSESVSVANPPTPSSDGLPPSVSRPTRPWPSNFVNQPTQNKKKLQRNSPPHEKHTNHYTSCYEEKLETTYINKEVIRKPPPPYRHNKDRLCDSRLSNSPRFAQSHAARTDTLYSHSTYNYP